MVNKIGLEVKMIILKDGVRYIDYEYASENELEKMVIEHYKEIFGKDALFFDKQMMKTKTGIKAKTDGFIISPDEKRWYILEVELSNHPLYEHIVPQITKFNQAYKSYETRKKITKAFNEDIKSSVEKEMVIQSKGIKEIHEFLTELVDSKPIIAILINVKTEELEEVCETLPFETRIIEFKTFVRENVGLEVHIHLFETLTKILPPGKKEKKKIEVKEITPQKAYRIPILEALIKIGGEGKVKDILNTVGDKMSNKLTPQDQELLPSGTSIRWANAAQFERQKMKEEGLLRADSPRGTWKITKKGEDYYRSHK